MGPRALHYSKEARPRVSQSTIGAIFCMQGIALSRVARNSVVHCKSGVAPQGGRGRRPACARVGIKNLKMFGGVQITFANLYDDDVLLKKHLDAKTLSVNSLSSPSPNTWTILMYSARGGRHKCVKLLLDYNSDVNYIDEDGSSPLHVCGLHPMCVKILVENGANLEAKNRTGETPLARCLRYNPEYYGPARESVFCLLLYGANITNVPDIPFWVQEFDATLKKRVAECRKALLTILYVCTRGAFRPLGEILKCAARQAWAMRGGEGCGPRAGGAFDAQGWGIDSQRESIKL